MPLTLLDADTPYEIIRIAGNDEVRKHLQSMGIVPGAVVRLLTKLGKNYIVKINDTSLGLTNDLAKRIIVTQRALC
ncbi:MAG: FeoA family protein [Lachnospiraceae bacterium]|nr:FeoA family protein [Lachnospiraceae bacterium]